MNGLWVFIVGFYMSISIILDISSVKSVNHKHMHVIWWLVYILKQRLNYEILCVFSGKFISLMLQSAGLFWSLCFATHIHTYICVCPYCAEFKMNTANQHGVNTFLFFFLFVSVYSLFVFLCASAIQSKKKCSSTFVTPPRSRWHCWEIYWDWKKLNLELKTGIPCINFARRCISK